ncbi:MAG: NAD-binding protein [Actinomycetota bacterium]|nr:NAD-binding protein [Actinomycetota bacterium]
MNAEKSTKDQQASKRPVIVLIGDGDLAEETERALEAAKARVVRLCQPDEDGVRDALEGEDVEAVAVVEREDAIVLRFALMVRGVSEDVPLLLTIFDPTMAAQVNDMVANTEVTSLADIVAPSLAGPCIDERFTAVSFENGKPVGLLARDGEVSNAPIRLPRPRRVEALARALFTPYDKSAGMLLFGAIGLAAVFTLETVTAMFTLDESAVDAIYGSAKTLVTVDPNPGVAEGPDWYKLFTSVSMIVALLLAAAFTAGLVNRFVERRLTGVVGRRVVPRRDHVVVVGLGQVGMRLCLLLRACKIPLVAVESDENGERVGIAKELGLPVVIGRGADPSLMRRLSLPRARAVAAVTADDLENISVAMTARGIHPDIRTVLRVGDGSIANETRSLLALGLVRDVHRLAATLLAAKILGRDAESVVCLDDKAHLWFPDGRLERAELDALAQ